MGELSDVGLVQQAAARDSASLAVLYDRHVGPVYRFSLSLLGSVEDAEDVTQEVFITAWRRAGSIRLVDRSALPWLLVTARLTCANRRRAVMDERRRRVEGDFDVLADPRFSPEDEVERRQLQAALEAAVTELSATDQRLYRLCIEDGMTYQDAAAALQLSHGAVRNRLSRVRTALRRELDPPTE